MPANPKSLKNLKPGNHGQGFKKGSAGNPGGRTVLEGMVRESIESNDRERMKQLVEDLYNAAHGEDVEEITEGEKDGKPFKQTKRYRKREMAAFEILFERGYGKVTQPLNVGGDLAKTISDLMAEKPSLSDD